MRVPPPIPRIDVEAAKLAIAAGQSAAEFARRAGHVAPAVLRALAREGVTVSRRRSKVRDAVDRHLQFLWRSVRARCENPHSVQYRIYGARGIGLCEAWHDFAVFRDWSRANGYAPGKGLALRSRKLGYSPWNCYWASRSEVIERGILAGDGAAWAVRAFGEVKTAEAWAADRRCSVSGETIRRRIRNGVPAALAITSPAGSTLPEPASKSVAKAPRVASRKRKRQPIDWERVRCLYVEECREVPEVARALGVSYHGVLHGLQARGWMRERGPRRGAQQPRTRLYMIWILMRGRCLAERRAKGRRVGVKRIRFPAAWADFDAFQEWALRSGYKDGLVLTRLDRDRAFGPNNSAWMTRTESTRYHRPLKVSHKPRWTITAFGETKGPTAWVRDPRCAVATVTGLVTRLKAGMPPEEAISTPSKSEGVDIEGRGVRAFGSTRSMLAWSRDRRARVGVSSIRQRLDRGIDPERAITTPPYQLDGDVLPRKRRIKKRMKQAR